MDNETAIHHVQDPILGNSGAGVEGSFLLEVEGEGGIRDVGDEMDFACCRNRRELGVGLGEDHRVGIRLAVRWQIDRHVLADGQRREDLTQPPEEQHYADNPQMTLGSFLDTLPVDDFVFLRPRGV